MNGTRSTTGRWVWVSGPKYYLDDFENEHPELTPNDSGASNGWWTCHEDTREGDLVVLYRSQQARDLAYLIRARSDARPSVNAPETGPGFDYACDYTVLRRFPRPIPISELRDDPVAATWPALRASFVRSAAPVPLDVWDRLMVMAGTSTSEIDERVATSLDTEVTEARIVAELERNPGVFAPHGYAMRRLQREFHVPGHGLADLVFFNPQGNPRVVIEVKKGPATTGAVAQIADYRAGLASAYPQGQRIKGVLVADSIDRRTQALLDDVPAVNFIPLSRLGLECLRRTAGR